MNITTQRLIVVVDDDAPVRLALGRLLGAAGFGVQTCASGEEFLRMLATRPVDCVILDLHMPDVDGFEVLERMSDAQTRTPVVVLTGHDSPEVRQRVTQAGIGQYITKPVQRNVILKAIESAMAGHEKTPID